MDINGFNRMMDEFGKVDPEIQRPAILVFLYIAQRGKCNQKDIERDLRLTNASASRNVSYWTKVKFRDQPGAGFINREEDPYDRRYKILTLTKEGEAFYKHLLEMDYAKAHRKGSVEAR